MLYPALHHVAADVVHEIAMVVAAVQAAMCAAPEAVCYRAICVAFQRHELAVPHVEGGGNLVDRFAVAQAVRVDGGRLHCR